MLDASDMMTLRDRFLSLDDYKIEKEATEKRIDSLECKNTENNLALVEIKTQLKLVLGVLAAVGIAILSLVVKQFWG